MKLDRRLWGGVWLAVALPFGAPGPALAKFNVPPPVVATPIGAGVTTQSVGFAKAVFDLPPGQPYGELQVGILCLPRTTLYWNSDRFSAAGSLSVLFAQEMKAAGVKVAGDPDDLFVTSGGSAQYLVAADIKGLSASYCYQLSDLHDVSDAKGGAIMDVEWQVYSTLERRTVARIRTVTGAKAGLGQNVQMQTVLDAYVQSVRALINSPEFRALVTAAPPGVGPAPGAADRALIRIAEAAGPPSVPDAVGSVVAIFAGGGFGSGFVIDNGYLLTNSHVVGDAAAVRVRWPDGIETDGQVVRADRRRDVALVRTDTRGRPALGLNTGAVRPSDTVFAIGTPLDPQFQNTVTKGIVSATRTIDNLFFIQSDVSVNHGNSGGPLLDETGKVIGITVAGYEVEGAPSGINLFIPVRDALDFLALRVGGAGPVATPAATSALSPPTPVSAGPVAEDGSAITDVKAWAAKTVDATGWTLVGFDQRAAYFGRPDSLRELPDGHVELFIRSELFRPERDGGSPVYSERDAWQFDCSSRRVRKVEVVAYGARNLQGEGTTKNSDSAAWTLPAQGSVVENLTAVLCGSATARAR
jgi:S1-C subfamily serine protease